jgi:hypothetical protein
VTNSRLRKAVALEKGPPKQKLRADIVKILGELKESQDGGFEGYSEKHNLTHKKLFLGTPLFKCIDITPHNIDLKH